MRIISKFQDYYDSIQAYGQDQTVVYIRKEEELVDQKIINDYYRRASYSSWREDTVGYLSGVDKYRGVEIEEGFSVFFCGQRYNGLLTSIPRPSHQLGGPILKTHYSLDELDHYIDSKNIEEEREYLNGWARRHGYKRNSVKTLERITNFFNEQKTDDDIHFQLDAPVFMIVSRQCKTGGYRGNQKTVVKNPRLKDYGFAQAKDPYSAYQELDMYISGVMGGKSPRMTTISDADMKNQKGFGHKYAFKTEPTKRR